MDSYSSDKRSEAASPPYRHVGLRRPSGQIRLLVLRPDGDAHSDLHCELTSVSLPITNFEYEALSYTWGERSEKHQLFIGDSVFEITQNLNAALRHLRYPDQARILWVDAVCIDQTNNQEKSCQVRLMYDIYARASTVLIWLGEPNESIDRLMNSDLSRSYRISQFETVQEAQEALIQFDLLKGLLCILTNNWFKRMWTLQEFLVAKEAVLICGKGTSPWECFRELVQPIKGHGTTPSVSYSGKLRVLDDSVDSTPLGRAIYSMIKLEEAKILVGSDRVVDGQDPWALDALLEATVNRDASDPRDKVYALFGLVAANKSRPRPLFAVDYTKPTGWAYQKASVCIYESRQSLDWLVYAISQDRCNKLSKPSWAVDFSEKSWDNTLRDQPWSRWLTFERYARGSKVKKQHREDLELAHDPEAGTITTAGFAIGAIESSVDFPGGCRHYHQNPAVIPAILMFIRAFSQLAYIALRKRLGDDEAQKKLAAGCVWDIAHSGSMIPIPADPSSLAGKFFRPPDLEAASLAFFKTFRFLEDEDCVNPAWAHLLPELPSEVPNQRRQNILFEAGAHIALEAGNSTLFATDNGYIGLAGSSVRKGDILCALTGCPYPLVLRALEDGTSRLVAWAKTDHVSEDGSQPERKDSRMYVLR